MAELTQAEIIANIQRRYGIYVTGAATTGSSATVIISPGLIERENRYTGLYVRMLTGTVGNLLAERIITSYSPGRLVCNTFASAVVAADTFEIKKLADADVSAAFLNALRAAGDSWLAIKTSLATTFADSEQIYTMPTDLVAILSVDIKIDPGTGLYQWKPFADYDIYGPPGTRVLRLRKWMIDPTLQPPTTFETRIQYLALPANSTSGIGMGGNAEGQAISFIEEHALSILHMEAFSRDQLADDARAHLTASQMHQETSREIRSRVNLVVGTRRYPTIPIPKHI